MSETISGDTPASSCRIRRGGVGGNALIDTEGRKAGALVEVVVVAAVVVVVMVEGREEREEREEVAVV